MASCRGARPCAPTSSRRNFRRLREERLQAELSRCMYSEQGLEALMRPLLAQVCQSLMVVSYCMPGSAHSQAAWAMRRMSSRARDLVGAGMASAPRMKETGPEARPPAVSRSFEERSRERLMPEPEPPLKIFPSVRYHSRMDSMESSMERMKQAEHWGFSSMPRLNQTGELKKGFWLTRMCFSSAWNASASSSSAKYSPCRPQSVMALTTRSMSCLTERSRMGVALPGAAAAASVRGPRKYLEATTLVAFWDQDWGNSMSRCSKTGVPSAPAMTAVRSDSHGISS